jgi:DNA (cytosine-5)-methyltransferase 1
MVWTQESARRAWDLTEQADRIAVGSVCSGYGGLDMGIAEAIPGTRLAWVADYEPPTEKIPNPKQGPSIILRWHWPDVPNLGDITAVRWADTARVKIVGGGTPCQDVSAAGGRKGMRDGTRSGIWSSMLDAIAYHRPTLVVWENVRGALSASADSDVESCPICLGDERECNLRALGRVLGDLADIGYDAVWIVLPASAVGAPHRRERVIVLGWPVENPDRAAGGERGVAAPGQAAGGRASSDAGGSDRAAAVADAEGFGSHGPGYPRSGGAGSADGDHDAADADQQGWEGTESAGRHVVLDGCSTPDADRRALRQQSVGVCGRCGTAIAGHPCADPVSDAEGDGRNEGRAESAGVVGGPDVALGGAAAAAVEWGEFGPAVRRWEQVIGRPAPAPTELSARGSLALAPRFVEWMMGLPAGHVTDVPGLTRNDQLKALGNGVVPQQAAAAIRYLLQFAPAWVREDLENRCDNAPDEPTKNGTP